MPWSSRTCNFTFWALCGYEWFGESESGCNLKVGFCEGTVQWFSSINLEFILVTIVQRHKEKFWRSPDEQSLFVQDHKVQLCDALTFAHAADKRSNGTNRRNLIDILQQKKVKKAQFENGNLLTLCKKRPIWKWKLCMNLCKNCNLIDIVQQKVKKSPIWKWQLWCW